MYNFVRGFGLACNMTLCLFGRDGGEKKVQFFNARQLERLTEQLQQVGAAVYCLVLIYSGLISHALFDELGKFQRKNR